MSVSIRVFLVAFTLLLASCAIDPPEKAGVWIYADGQRIALTRTPKAQIDSKLFSPSYLEKLPRIESANHFVLRSKKGLANVKGHFLLNPVAKEPEIKIDIAPIEPLDKHPNSGQIKPTRELEAGYIVLRVLGSGMSGYYTFVLGDSYEWAMREADSYYEAQQYTNAIKAYRRAVEFRDTAVATAWLARSLMDNNQFKDALSVAEDGYDLAETEGKKLVWYGGLLAEALMLNGDYRAGLSQFDNLRDRYPGDVELERHLARLLSGVRPQPDDLVVQIYKAASKKGNDAVEAFIYETDLDEAGSESRLTKFVRKLNSYGRVKKLDVTKVQRLGRSATVSYQVRFSDGSKFTRKMNFYLSDGGIYKARLN